MSLIYAREWNDIFNDPRTKSALPPLKLPKHQFFPLHLATLPTRPVPSLPFLAPCYLARPPFPPSLITVPKPIQERNSSSRVERSNFVRIDPLVRVCVCGKANVTFGTTRIRRGFVDESWEVVWEYIRHKDIPRVTRCCDAILRNDSRLVVRFRLGFAYRGAWKREQERAGTVQRKCAAFF